MVSCSFCTLPSALSMPSPPGPGRTQHRAPEAVTRLCARVGARGKRARDGAQTGQRARQARGRLRQAQARQQRVIQRLANRRIYVRWPANQSFSPSVRLQYYSIARHSAHATSPASFTLSRWGRGTFLRLSDRYM